MALQAIPEGCHLHTRRRENVNSRTVTYCWFSCLFSYTVSDKCCRPAINTPASYSEGLGFKSRPGKRLSSLRVFVQRRLL
jgi:hypothetical protein